MCLSFYQCHCPSASKHLCPPQPVCYPDAELRFLRDLLLLFLCFLHLAVCFLPPHKCMAPALGRKEGSVTKYRRTKNTINLVSQNHAYNNKNIF